MGDPKGYLEMKVEARCRCSIELECLLGTWEKSTK